MSLDRPLYFITVFWGERFRNYFAEYALPSLMASGNLPSLPVIQPTPPHKLLIACYPEDAEVLARTTIMRKAMQHVEVQFIDLPKCPPGQHGCTHMGVGHKLACEIAFKDRAYGVILAPDTIFSNKAVSALVNHAKAGAKLVLAPACLRLAEEPFIRELMAIGVLPRKGRASSGMPIEATGAQLAEASIRSLHSASVINEWDAPYAPVGAGAPCVFFRVSGNDGFLIHCLSWAPLLIDYSACKAHDTSCLEQWTIDGDYVFKNLGETRKVHVVRDSDELVYAGFTPKAEQAINLHYFFRDMPRDALDVLKSEAMHKNYNSGIFDPLKQRLFRDPVTWHAHEMDSRWHETASRARRIIDQALAA